jgi:hypothetical protein
MIYASLLYKMFTEVAISLLVKKFSDVDGAFLFQSCARLSRCSTRPRVAS